MVVAAPREGPRLLERESVLGGLRESLAEARRGRGRLALVVGEAGAGKSAAVCAFCDEARGLAQVLWGGCDPLFTPRPLGPFLDIAEETGGELQAAVEQGPAEVAAALLRTAADHSATIVVVEDVHWADEATLDALRLLGRKLDRAPLLVVATCRDDELDRAHPLRIVLGELATQPHVDRLPIPPLSPEAVAELAAASEVDAAELHRLTAGNPFLVTEVLASGDVAIPTTVRDAVLARAARLSESARALLDGVAIAPPRVELWLLDALAGEHVSALEECLASGMLLERAGSLEFRHELARLALEESLPPDRRLALHRTALTSLADPPAGLPDLARLAHHAEAADDAEAVVKYAPAAAARAASVGAHREAAAFYACAVRFVDEPSSRADLLDGVAREAYLTGDFAEAFEACSEALAAHRAVGARRKEAASLGMYSRLLWFFGQAKDAMAAGQAVVALLETFPPDRELAMAYGNLSGLAAKCGDASQATASGRRAIELAHEIGDRETVSYAVVWMSAIKALRGDPADTAKLEETLEAAIDAGFEEVAADAFDLLVRAAVESRSFATVERYLARGIDYCSERDLGTWRQSLVALGARADLDRGRWGDAAAGAARVLRTARTQAPAPALARSVLALVRARRGDPGVDDALDDAIRPDDTSAGALRPAPAAPPVSKMYLGAARAEIAWLRGDPAAVVAATEEALNLAVRGRVSWIVGELACWRRRAGIEEAIPAQVPKPCAAQVAGDWRRAAELWAELGCPYEAALALADADEEEPLRRALDELQHLGARPAAAIVARRLQERGVRNVPRGPRPSTRLNEAQLTARELDVLRLLAEGLRNAAIAKRLFVSPRTVDHHVSAILRKLDVQSRGEAVAEAGRLGLLQDR